MSTPIILVAIAAALFPGGSAPLQGLLFLTVVVLIFLEAVARRSLLHLVATLVAIAAIVALVAALAALVVNFGWQRTLAATTLVLAGLLLIANLSELTRD